MKKLFFAFSLSLMLNFVCAAQFAENDREFEGVNGNVKTIVFEEAEIVFEAGKYVEKNRQKWRTKTFDLEGNLVAEEPKPPTEIVCGIRCNNEKEEYKYKYNKQGKIIEEITVLEDGIIASKREFDYDLQRKLLETRFYSANEAGDLELDGKWVYTRRENEVKASRYSADDVLIRWNEVKFDEYKNVIENAGFRAGGLMTSKSAYTYKYDERGNWTKRTIKVWVTKNGKSFFEPVESEYRTITYFEN